MLVQVLERLLAIFALGELESCRQRRLMHCRLLLVQLLLPAATPLAQPPVARPLITSASRAFLARAQKAVVRPLRNKLPRWLRGLIGYADVRPFTEKDPESLLFISTNIVFFAVGASLQTTGGAPAFGLLTDLAGVASTAYHYTQCAVGGSTRPAVQAMLLLDYAFAVPSVFAALAYAAELGDALPSSAVWLGVAATAALAAGWIWDAPRQYFVIHGAWHVLGALAIYEMAAAHGAQVG